MRTDDYIDDPGVWTELLKACVLAAHDEAIALRLRGYLKSDGSITRAARLHLSRGRVRGNLRTQVLYYSSATEVCNLGKFIYHGGLDQMLEMLGLPQVGSEVKSRVENKVSRIKAGRSNANPIN